METRSPSSSSAGTYSSVAVVSEGEPTKDKVAPLPVLHLAPKLLQVSATDVCVRNELSAGEEKLEVRSWCGLEGGW